MVDERLHVEYADLRAQWLKDNAEKKNPNDSANESKLMEELSMARTEITTLQELAEVVSIR